VADGAAHLFGLGNDVGGLHRELRPESLAALGLSPAALEVLAADVVGEVHDLLGNMAGAGEGPRLAAVPA
ncbi:MAG: hypothetical protein JNK82_03290, partial [Myxococcaceae bacterium]|nr:hypothetical protein [Myxococcaceae bacterium]